MTSIQLELLQIYIADKAVIARSFEKKAAIHQHKMTMTSKLAPSG